MNYTHLFIDACVETSNKNNFSCDVNFGAEDDESLARLIASVVKDNPQLEAAMMLAPFYYLHSLNAITDEDLEMATVSIIDGELTVAFDLLEVFNYD